MVEKSIILVRKLESNGVVVFTQLALSSPEHMSF